MLLAPYVRFHILVRFVTVTEWPHIGKKAAHSNHAVFSWSRHLIVNLSDCAFSLSLPSFKSIIIEAASHIRHRIRVTIYQQEKVHSYSTSVRYACICVSFSQRSRDLWL